MPNYYEISEGSARQAKEAYSWSDYKPGSATADYRAAVDEAAELAAELALPPPLAQPAKPATAAPATAAPATNFLRVIFVSAMCFLPLLLL